MSAEANVARFRALLAQRLGLHFEDAKLPFLENVLRHRSLNARDTNSYLDQLEGGRARAEIDALARELTVTETYFFRHQEQFRAFAAIASRQRAATTSNNGLRVLSAGCASGEEPYSLAILLADQRFESRAPALRAVDVNPDMLERARAARYGTWSLRDMPDELCQRWFRAEGRTYVLNESIRKAVTFETRNLAEDNHDLFLPSSFDVVFCRNVLMYFTPENARALIAKIARALAPGGFLFLGYAETLRGLSNDFHLCHTHEAFYYRRKHANDLSEYDPSGALGLRTPTDPLDSDWVEAIGRASARIDALACATPPRGRSAEEAQTARIDVPAWNLAPAFELLRNEQFAQALALVEALPEDAWRDPDVLLLRALLLTHGGRLEQAALACDALLAQDELSAGAHYLIALCHEAKSDRLSAAEHYRIAIYLDPGFAMAQLHLGLLARRNGEPSVARRELAQARTLLEREDDARLQLFGGGFERAALLALCDSELVACGVAQ